MKSLLNLLNQKGNYYIGHKFKKGEVYKAVLGDYLGVESSYRHYIVTEVTETEVGIRVLDGGTITSYHKPHTFMECIYHGNESE